MFVCYCNEVATLQPGLFVFSVYSQLMLASPYDDEGLNMYLQLIDKCINHEVPPFSYLQSAN